MRSFGRTASPLTSATSVAMDILLVFTPLASTMSARLSAFRTPRAMHPFMAFSGRTAKSATSSRFPGTLSYATAISDKGVVVGLSIDANFNLRAVFWQNGKMTNLNDLVPADTPLFLQTACSINGLGQITGIALAKGTTNEYHAYLASPMI